MELICLLKKNTFDTIISFQVIEHISPKLVHLYLKEIKRSFKRRWHFYFNKLLIKKITSITISETFGILNI